MAISMLRFNASGYQKIVSETKMLSFEYKRTFNVFLDVNVGVKNHNFKFSLILDKYNIMIVMQKSKFMQEFTFAINAECLHSS